jgi:small subunit ribosomal protein S2
VVAICDSNSDPEDIDFPVPGNDDAIRAINTYCDLISGSVLDGIQAELTADGIDIGAAEDVVVDEAAAEIGEAAAAPAAGEAQN